MTAKKKGAEGKAEKEKKQEQERTIKKKATFLLAFELSAGNVSMACKKAKISRNTYYRWCNEDPDFKEACWEVDESMLDLAESQLKKKIKEGTSDTLLIFYLKTKGKDRGYIEKVIHRNENVDLDADKSDEELQEELEQLQKEVGMTVVKPAS